MQDALTRIAHLAETVLGSFAAPGRGLFSNRLPPVEQIEPQGKSTATGSGGGGGSGGDGGCGSASGKDFEGIELGEEKLPAQGTAPSDAGSWSGEGNCSGSHDLGGAVSSMQAGSGGGGGGRDLSLQLHRQASEAGSAAFYDSGTPRKGDPDSHARHRAWLRRHALGATMHAVHAEVSSTSSAIYRIGNLVTPARFDYNPFRRPHRLPPEAITTAKMACRRAFNAVVR